MSALQDKMKHTIDEIEGLPEGWKAVAYRLPKHGETCWHQNFGIYTATVSLAACFIVEKIQPRRIVLEETEEKYLGCQTLYIDGTEIMIMTNKTWREVKENDLSLNKDEPKLSLSVGDVKRILSNWLYCEDIVNRMREFLKEN